MEIYMGVQTYIGVSYGDGTYRNVFCHDDKEAKDLLLKYFNNDVAVDDLMKMGSFFVLQEVISIFEVDDRLNRSRDFPRKSLMTFPSEFDYIEYCCEKTECDILYLWKDGEWYYSTHSEFVKLEKKSKIYNVSGIGSELRYIPAPPLPPGYNYLTLTPGTGISIT